MELSSLKFAVDTTELDRAGKVIAELAVNVGKLDKTAREAAKTEEILAKAAKANAEANLANAKAQDQRLKSTITADKADQAAEKAVAKTTKAVKENTDAVKENVSILQRQTDIYDFMAQGFSKGQSSILATAKATGQLSEELKKVLVDMKQFSSDPFDKSDTGLKRMQKTIKEVTDAQKYFNEGSNLTTKQARELSNDLDRLTAGLKQQGKSYNEIVKAQATYKQQFLEEAAVVNKASNALAIVEKQRKDVVTATNYVTKADQQMAAALNQSNAALDKGGTDSLVRYEAALRRSGVSQELATSKLKTYKAQLEQVQKAEMARREQFLSRAIMPQVTDVAVSLWSGQNPLTVLLQQGGQVTDLFNQSGIAAEKFGESVKTAMKGMLPSILTVVKGVGGLIVDGFVAAGSAVTGFLGKITGFTAASDQVYKFLASDGPSVAAQRWAKLSDVLSKGVAVGFAAVITVLAAMAVEYKNIIQAEGELSKALATSGGAMGLSKDQAVAYAESMKGIGVGTLKAMAAITEFTKVGKIGKDGLDLIIKSALDLEKYAGVAISETAKKFAEIQDEPTKALIKFAESNGYVSASVLDTVASLEQQGDKVNAATVATEAMRLANNAMAEEAKANLSPIEKLWDDIKSAIGRVKQEIYDLTTSNEVVGAMKTVWETISVAVAEVWFTLKGVGKEIGGIAAQIAAVLRGDFAGAKSIGEQMQVDAAAARAEQDKLIASILNREETEKKSFSDSKERNSQYAAWRKDNEKALERQFSKEERLGLKKKQLQNDLNAGIIDEIKYKQALAGWERIIMGEKKPKVDKQPIKDLETEIDLRNKALGLLSSFNNELDAIERRRAVTGDEEQYQQSLNDLIKKQPIYIQRQKEINDAHDLENKLLGQADMLGKDYYKTLELIQQRQDSGLYSPEQAEKLRQAEFDRTQLVKENLKYIEESNKTYNKYKEDTQKTLDNTILENQKLDDRLVLMNLTSEQQKYMKIEQQQRNALLVVEQKLQQKIADIREDMRTNKIDPFYGEKAIIEAEKAAAEERKVINKEVAVQYAEDFMAEMQKIKSGITDSIVTALFEGGKAGGKKLRETLISILRQKVTIVVDAVVNTLLGNVIGSIAGALGLGGAGGAAGSILGSIGGSALTGVAGQALGIGSASSLVGGFTGSIIPASMVGPSVAAPTVMSGLGNMLSAIPGWGWAIAGAGAILGLLIGADDSGTYHTGGLAQYSAAGGSQTSTTHGAFGMGFGGVEYGKATTDAMVVLSKSLVDIFDGIAKTFGKTAGYEVAVAFADDTSKDGAWGGFRVALQGRDIMNWDQFRTSRWAPKEFGDGEEGYKQYLGAVAKDTRQILLDMDLPSWADKILTDIGDTPTMETVTAAVQQIMKIKTGFDDLTATFKNYIGISEDAQTALLNAAGGIEALTSAASYFYENFYSDEEKATNLRSKVTDEFKKLGLTVPKTKEEFKKLVDGLDLNTEAGRTMYVELLKLAPLFNQMTTATENLASADQDRVNSAADAAKQLIAQQIQTQKELLNIQLEAAQALMNNWQQIFDYLSDQVKKLYGTVDAVAKQQDSEARNLITAAVQGGTVPDLSTLQDAVSTVTGGMSSRQYGSKVEADRDRLRFAAQLDALKGTAEYNLKQAKNTVDLLTLQLKSLDDLLENGKDQIDAIVEVGGAVEDVVDAINKIPSQIASAIMNPGDSTGGSSAPRNPGGGGGDPAGPNPYTSRVDYSPEEALTSFEKFKAWYVGLRTTAGEMNKDYKVPDWLRVTGFAEDSSDKELFGQFLFFKNNPKYAKDFQDILSGGTSSYDTSGASLVKTDLTKLPTNIAEYFKGNIPELLQYEGMGFDPVLAYEVYKNGPEQYGLDPKDTNIATWLRGHKWTPNGVVANDNPLSGAQAGYRNYNVARYDSSMGAVVDVDGTIYSFDGQRLGTASRQQMIDIYGPDWKPTEGSVVGDNQRSDLYNRNTSSGMSEEEYYKEIRRVADLVIAAGATGDDVAKMLIRTGTSMQDLAVAYGTTPDVIAQNLRDGGARTLPAFADGGNYAGGLALVGEEGPELINFNRGGYVHTASQTASIMNSENTSEQLDMLNKKIDMLEAAARSTAVSNNKIAKILDRVTPDGNSLTINSSTLLTL